MKKIAMFTMGTRGDVQPYIYLSKELIRNGYDVTLGSHPCWRNLIEESGIHFEPIGPAIDIEKEAAMIRGKCLNPAISMLKTMNFVFRIIQNSTNEIYEVCKGQDLIIVSHSQMGATEAEALGIPTVNVTLQKEMIAEKRKPQTFKDKVIGGLIGRKMAKPYNKIRKVYGLKPVKAVDEIMSHILNLVPVSKYVVERNLYWEDHHILTGYWFEEEEKFVPDEKLDMFVNAFKKADCRAVIRGCFVIHHCGFVRTGEDIVVNEKMKLVNYVK